MNKNKLLIIGCVFTVLALLIIQCYFIYNTYQLKEREIKFEVKSTLEKLDGREQNQKSDLKDDREQEILIEYETKKINRKQFVLALQLLESNYAKTAMQFIEEKFKLTNYDVGFSKNILSIITIHNGINTNLINEKIELYKYKNLLNFNELLFKTSWHTSNDSSTDSEGKIRKFEYEVKKTYNYSINNLQYLVLSQMIGLLIISFLLVVFIIFLLYYLIKNLLKVNKISETQRDFINNITHEFKTPLATLSIATKTLNNHFLEKENLENTVAIIERQNIRLQKIFNQVNFNSILTNIENIKIDKNINLEFIENCINDFKIAKPEIEIQSDIDSDIELKMSKFHFNTIASNLLENAVKYGGTKLEIIAKPKNNFFVLKIKDNGIGIPKNEQNSIFEKFYRVSNGDIHNTKGLGLGLFYTKEIIEIYNGKIVVESSDKGSEFVISIPKS